MAEVIRGSTPGDIIEAGKNAPPSVVISEHDNPGSVLTRQMTTEMVKGVGFTRGSNKPEEDYTKLAPMLFRAQDELYKTVRSSSRDPMGAVKAVSPEFRPWLERIIQASPMNAGMAQLVGQLQQQLSAAIGKDISLTSPISTGIVPFDLVAPSKLIYPMYSPLRNKIPRVKGQGSARRSKLITGFPGTQTAGQGFATRISIPEFPNGQSFGANWPMQLPPSTSNAGTDLVVPYKFFGLTEPISWLSEFAGQGFQDISALANLLLLQKFMLSEEYMLVGGSSTNFAAPAAPVLVARTAASNETALSGYTSSVYVTTTGVGYYGQTPYTSGSVTGIAVSAGQVVDVFVKATPGQMQSNIWVGNGAGVPSGATAFYPAPGSAATGSVGTTRYTLQGALTFSGSVHPPTTDTGTGSATDYDGMISILSGQASSTYAVPAGYYNAAPNSQARVSLFNKVFETLWQSTKADPSEVVMEGSDVGRLSDDIRLNASNQAYNLFVAQGEVSNVLAGAAVAELVNPVTRKRVPILVHPWLPQGNALFLSYSLPFPYSETPNVWESVNVQDYLSVAWPVIDVTFRYSMFQYGALVAYAPCSYEEYES